jgi:ribosomal-protein-alanine N-acetyltransferase
MIIKHKIFSELNGKEKHSVFKIIKSLDDSLFPNPWSETSWNNFLSHQNNYTLIIYYNDDENLIGFCLYALSSIEKLAHLLKILIIPEFRGKSLGKEILQISAIKLLSEGLEDIYLEVEETNTSAIKSYRKFGLNTIHSKKNFYGEARNAIIMKGPLKVE